jgi:hypothetical protein
MATAFGPEVRTPINQFFRGLHKIESDCSSPTDGSPIERNAITIEFCHKKRDQRPDSRLFTKGNNGCPGDRPAIFLRCEPSGEASTAGSAVGRRGPRVMDLDRSRGCSGAPRRAPWSAGPLRGQSLRPVQVSAHRFRRRLATRSLCSPLSHRMSCRPLSRWTLPRSLMWSDYRLAIREIAPRSQRCETIHGPCSGDVGDSAELASHIDGCLIELLGFQQTSAKTPKIVY